MIDQLAALPEDTRIMVLAPVVAGRKGEQADLLDELRAQGFTRVRIDGTVHELDGKPRLAKNVKHSVDVVIDRVRVRPMLASASPSRSRRPCAMPTARPSWSRPTRRRSTSSPRATRPACDYALPELEPRLFSFNNPMGACPRCDGLGSVEFFDPKRIVAHPNLSLASGAIRGWDRRNHFYYSMLQSLAKHYRFDIESPWEMLDERIQNLILYGSGTRRSRSSTCRSAVGLSRKEHPFEGVIPNHERRYRETDSLVREELAKLRNLRACPECEGARLRREARHVRVGEKTLHQVSAWPLRQTQQFFTRLNLKGAKGEVAGRIVREIASRLEFLVNVGLDYLTLERGAETLRRRRAAHPAREPDRLGSDRRDVCAR